MSIMKLFTRLYDKTIQWSGHTHAPYYLAGVSFAESSFFPIPPDVMLISMGLAQPKKAWYYALITTIFSVFGGIFGYCIGYFFGEIISPFIEASSFRDTYHQVEYWFINHGVIVTLIAGFSPIPYKLFTIAAGVLQMAFLPFVLASFVSRGLRFFIVSGLMYFMGEKLHEKLRRYVDYIAWGFLLLLALIFLVMKFV